MKFRKFSASFVRHNAENARYLFRMRSGYKLGLFSHFRVYGSRHNLFSSVYRRLVAVASPACRDYTRREKVHHVNVARRLHPISGFLPKTEKRSPGRRYYVARLDWGDVTHYVKRNYGISHKMSVAHYSAKYAEFFRFFRKEAIQCGLGYRRAYKNNVMGVYAYHTEQTARKIHKNPHKPRLTV